ncbi:acyl carrier protein [Comamonadaceae bacterium M7527]|nr:acyl carrier protein [Comamonadaceae bacterium M7527]
MEQEILHKARDIILDIVDIEREKIVPEASLRDDLQADSLASVEIVMALEDQFKIQFDEEQARSFVTVGELVAAIEAMRCINATPKTSV